MATFIYRVPFYRNEMISLLNDSLGNEIEVLDTGDGHPILLISGLGGHWNFWNPVIEIIKKTNRVIAFNHPGITNGITSNRPSIANLVQTSIDILNILEMHQASVIGHSTGGLIAHSLALDHPDRVDRLVLSGTWAKADQRFRDLCSLRISLLSQIGLDAHRIFSQLLGYPTESYRPPAPLKIDDLEKEKIISLTIQRLEMLISHNRSHSLKNIYQQTLIIGARDDQIVSASNSLDLHQLIPNSKMYILNEGGHFFPQNKPQEFSGLLHQHLHPSN